MRSWIRRATAALAVAVTLSSAGTALASPPPAADAVLAPYDRADSPGVAVGVYQNGQVVYSRAVGMANLEYGQAERTGTVSNAASVSKQFTAFAIALLERDGKIDASADVHRYLPELPDFGATVTVADLVHHTSGLRDSNILLDLANREGGDRIRQAQVLRLVGQQHSLMFPPGSEFSYSNTGYILLAEIVQRVSGKSLRQFTTERIFQPLGMSNTFFRDDTSQVIPGWADSYAPKPGGGWRRAIHNAEAIGSTGLATTADDLLKWVANFDNPTVGDAALVEKIAAPGRLKDGGPVNYGYGLWRLRYAGRDAVAHDGSIAGYRALVLWLPKERFGVVVVANRPVDAADLAVGLIKAWLGAAPVAPATASAAARKEDAPVITPPVEVLQGLTGRYIPNRMWSAELVADGSHLYWTSTMAPKVPLLLREGDIFSRGLGEATRWFQFVRDGEGRVTGFRPLSDIGSGLGDVFRRSPAYVAPPAALRELEGDYRAPGVDATYTLLLKDGRLVARSLWSSMDANLVPVAKDRFDTDRIGLGVLEVRRDTKGRVVGLNIIGGGLAGMTLDRLAKPRPWPGTDR